MRLDKSADEPGLFSKTTNLPLDKKIAYKYVVDGRWLANEVEPLEYDAASNANNYLKLLDDQQPGFKGMSAATSVI